MVRLPPRLRPYFPYLKSAYNSVTRAAAPTALRLGRLHGDHLPSGWVPDLDQAAATTGGTCVLARPAESVSRPAAQGLPAGNRNFVATAGTTIPRVAVAELPDARVVGPHRAVVTARGDLVDEVSRYFGNAHPRQHPLFLHPFLDEPLHVEGRLGVLASRGDLNYYHFLVDVLPRVDVVRQAGVDTPDRWYVPASMGWQRELLAMVGLTDDMILDSARYPHVRADRLVVPGQPAMTVLNPPWVVEYLRDRLLAGRVPVRDAPIYVTRGPSVNNRSVINEDDVVDLLAGRGFRVVNPGGLSVAEQIELFAGAPVIVSAHGAGLTNEIFASAGTTVIEMFPAAWELPDCYWTMCHSVPGVDYRYLVGRGRIRREPAAAALVRDIDVDLDALARLVDDVSG